LTDPQAVLAVMKNTDFDFSHDGDLLRVKIDGHDETGTIREPHVTEQVRHIAAAPLLREQLVKLQQDFAAQFDRVVTEGRDQGTVVFPNAQYKFFLTADPTERTRRRHDELKAAGKAVDPKQLHQQIIQRDASDENRSVGPLKPATDAIMIDTTHINADQVVHQILETIHHGS